jgi:hypothetical protein
MSEPSLDRATTAIGQLSKSVRDLHDEVVQSESLRAQKIRLMTQVMAAIGVAAVLLVLLAASNFVLLNRIKAAASDARSTNDLLVGCFTPGTPCSNESTKRTGEALEQLRQTQFVIAVCQRRHPVVEDPDGVAMVSCVQQYYPTFHLPAKTK